MVDVSSGCGSGFGFNKFSSPRNNFATLFLVILLLLLFPGLFNNNCCC